MKPITARFLCTSILIVCHIKEIISFSTSSKVSSSSCMLLSNNKSNKQHVVVSSANDSKSSTTQLLLSFYDRFEYDEYYNNNEEDDEVKRIKRLIAERIEAENAKFQSRYNTRPTNNNNNDPYKTPTMGEYTPPPPSWTQRSAATGEQFASERMLSRDDRIMELKRISAANARAQRIAAMKAAMDEEKRRRFEEEEADKVQDEFMAAEMVRLEAQQRARNIAEKRLAEEEKKRNKKDKSSDNDNNKRNNNLVNNIGSSKTTADYQALMTDGMQFATEKAEKFISEEEARIAEASRLNRGRSTGYSSSSVAASSRFRRNKSTTTQQQSSSRYHRLASPKQLLSRISVEEAKVKEEKQLVTEILQEAKIASEIAQSEADATELVRLAAVQAEAERLIEQKNKELDIIAEEKRLANDMANKMGRRDHYY